MIKQLFELLLYCGLRRGELIALTWNDISIKNKSVAVNKGAVFVKNQGEIKGPSQYQVFALSLCLIRLWTRIRHYTMICRSGYKERQDAIVALNK